MGDIVRLDGLCVASSAHTRQKTTGNTGYCIIPGHKWLCQERGRSKFHSQFSLNQPRLQGKAKNSKRQFYVFSIVRMSDTEEKTRRWDSVVRRKKRKTKTNQRLLASNHLPESEGYFPKNLKVKAIIGFKCGGLCKLASSSKSADVGEGKLLTRKD